MTKALFVEDRTTFSESLKGSLHRRFPLLEIDDAISTDAAINKLNDFAPDLIFMDAHFSGSNSFDLARTIKSLDSHAVIIMLANFDLKEYQHAAQHNGADYFLSKEMPLDDIFNLVGGIISNHK